MTFELVTKAEEATKVTILGKMAVSDGKATLTLAANKVLQKAITIVYSGDTNDMAATVTMPKLT